MFVQPFPFKLGFVGILLNLWVPELLCRLQTVLVEEPLPCAPLEAVRWCVCGLGGRGQFWGLPTPNGKELQCRFHNDYIVAVKKWETARIKFYFLPRGHLCLFLQVYTSGLLSRWNLVGQLCGVNRSRLQSMLTSIQATLSWLEFSTQSMGYLTQVQVLLTFWQRFGNGDWGRRGGKSGRNPCPGSWLDDFIKKNVGMDHRSPVNSPWTQLCVLGYMLKPDGALLEGS